MRSVPILLVVLTACGGGAAPGVPFTAQTNTSANKRTSVPYAFLPTASAGVSIYVPVSVCGGGV